jgi:hypothetical protein
VPPLSVGVQFRSSEFQSGLDLPVEVRRSNMSLVAAGLTAHPFDVPEGDYVVLAHLPAGQQLISKVTVSANGGSVQLAPRKEEESPHENHETVHYLSDVRGIPASKTSVTATWEFAIVEEFSPTALGLALFPQPEPIGELIRYSIGGADKQQYLQVSNSTTKKRINTAIVASEGQYVSILLPKAVTTARITPEVTLQNLQANYLLAAMRKGALRQAELASRSDAMSAERLLLEKVRDPFAACVGAYTLLTLGEVERLHDWTKNLQDWFTWLSDGLAIRGEHLARLGQHDEAVSCLTQIPTRGVPSFSMGIGIAANRLRQYRTMFASDSRLQGALKSAEEYLKPLTQLINPGQPVTTSFEQAYGEGEYEEKAAVAAH